MIILLDTFPTSSVAKRPGTRPTLPDRCRRWVHDCEAAGHTVLVPAICYYEARRAGLPTASLQALDGDVILAAQALSLGLSPSDYMVATTNIGHLSRFVPCGEWANITP